MSRGGAGFLGTILLEALLSKGYQCVSIDLHPHSIKHPKLLAMEGDICDPHTLQTVFKKHTFSTIIHCAALLAHGKMDKKKLWETNVFATERLAAFAVEHGVKKFIFISSNCLWGKNFNRLVKEDDIPEPVEIYGQSKYAAEIILKNYQSALTVIIFRCPTIIDAGRLGLLSILFEFIKENRKVYVVGGGTNRYQFIYAKDLTNAILLSLSYSASNIFNIGSDKVKSLREVFSYVIEKAGTNAKIVSLPKWLTLNVMKLAYFCRVSPLGPYHYKMIAEDFIFDTNKIKKELNWIPTLTNEEMLLQGYDDYAKRETPYAKSLSVHKKPAKMGLIRLLKWLS